MFTGIIEELGQVKEVMVQGSNAIFWVASSLSAQFRVDQSVSHDGVCLTVEEIQEGLHRVTAVGETLKKTNLGTWKPGRFINLERSLKPDSRLDGHFVQGHADTTAVVKKIKDLKGSMEMEFRFPSRFAELVIEKGSVAVNGISLTAFNVKKQSFRVAVIPFTFAHTNLQYLIPGDEVNIEFDMIGKYILRRLSLQQ